MTKKKKLEYSPSNIIFGGIAVLKENTGIFRKIIKDGLLVIKTGIDFLLLQVEEPKKKTKVKKIKIE